jgi:uncharacterized phage protein (TIGR02216 family)
VTFLSNASQLCGQIMLLFGWEPDAFWQMTPAELQCLVAAMQGQNEAPPDAETLAKLMEQFPDG